MKRTVIWLMALFLLLSSACSGVNEKIVGTWTAEGDDMTVTLTFNKDGTCLYDFGSFQSEGYWEATDDTLTMRYANLNNSDMVFTYEVTSLYLRLTGEGGDVTRFKKVK